MGMGVRDTEPGQLACVYIASLCGQIGSGDIYLAPVHSFCKRTIPTRSYTLSKGKDRTRRAGEQHERTTRRRTRNSAASRTSNLPRTSHRRNTRPALDRVGKSLFAKPAA